MTARAAELRASAAAREAGEEARAARIQAAKLAGERESLAAAVSSLQVCRGVQATANCSNACDVPRTRLSATQIAGKPTPCRRSTCSQP